MAEELELKGDLKAAEEQYMLGGDWAAAVNMYRKAEQWSEAFQIAKFEGGEKAYKQVFYEFNNFRIFR